MSLLLDHLCKGKNGKQPRVTFFSSGQGKMNHGYKIFWQGKDDSELLIKKR